MNKLKVIALAAAVSSALMSGVATAGVTANVGATSNYLWRGISLSNEASAISGGVDYSHDTGAYAGIWVSSEGLAGATGETDLYVGFAGEVDKFSYDVGFIAYEYTQLPSADFDEVYFSVGYDFATFYYANSSDIETDYMSLTLSYDKFSLTYGDYSFDLDSTLDYSHFDLSVALTDEVSLTYSQNDIDDPANPDEDGGRFVISYALEFDVK